MSKINYSEINLTKPLYLDENIVPLQKFRLFNNICLKDTNTEYFQLKTKKTNYKGIYLPKGEVQALMRYRWKF